MKFQSLTLDSLKTSFAPLTKLEQTTIKGGDFITDLMATIFMNNGAHPLTQGELTKFVSLITQLNETVVGHDLLQSLYNNGTAQTLVNEDGNANFQNIAEWKSDNTLHFKLLDSPTDSNGNTSTDADKFRYIAHELYHNYALRVDQKPTNWLQSVQSEVDAELFSTMAVVEYDETHPTTYAWDLLEHGTYTAQFLPNAGMDANAFQLFKSAWDDIIINHNFTAANYNTLVENFMLGSTYGGNLPLNQNSPVTLADLVNDPDNIYEIFVQDYEPVFPAVGGFSSNPFDKVNPYGNNGGTAGNCDFFDPWNIGYGNSNSGGSVNSSFNINYLNIGGYNTSNNSSLDWNTIGSSLSNLNNFINQCWASGIAVTYNGVAITQGGTTGGGNGSSGGTGGSGSSPRSSHWGGAGGRYWDDTGMQFTEEEMSQWYEQQSL